MGSCSLASNRDLVENGRALTGYNAVVEADRTVLMGRLSDDQDVVRATIINYACHPTTLAWQNHLLSPDYVGAASEVVEGATGGAPCLFLQGASGELAPRHQYVGDTEVADRHGRELGYAALAALSGMLPAGKRLGQSRHGRVRCTASHVGTRQHGAPDNPAGRHVDRGVADAAAPRLTNLLNGGQGLTL